MRENPLVSIITGVFNGRQFLDACYRAVMAQTYTNFEWIVVDDQSTDNSFNILSSWTDHRIRLLQTESNTGGPAGPRNVAVSCAKGDFIALLDQDDLWEPDKLEKQLELIRRYPDLGLLSSNLRYAGPHKQKRLRPGIRKPGLLFPTAGDIYRENPFLSSAIIMKRSAVEDVHGFDEHPEVRGRDEWELAIRIALKYRTAFNGNHIAGMYYVHQNNLSRQISSFVGMEYIRNKHDNNFPESLVRDVRARDCYNMARDALRLNNVDVFKKYIKQAAAYRPFYKWKGLFLQYKYQV